MAMGPLIFVLRFWSAETIAHFHWSGCQHSIGYGVHNETLGTRVLRLNL